MSDKRRPYKMKRRAEQEAQTKLRITESAVELHGSLGPARTSMSAVAEHAGVPRSTLYRHFPDERALFGACSAHWREANPRPDISRWGSIEDPDERTTAAFAELYAYYRQAEEMLDKLLRDAPTVPIVNELMGGFHFYLAEAAKILMQGRGLRGNAAKRARAAIGHALAFRTWQDLTRTQGLDDKQASELMSRLVGVSARTA